MNKLAIEQLAVLFVGPVDLAVDAGCCAGIRGASGSGKTLFLRAVADMAEHAGRVFLDGIEAREMSGPAWRRQVGMLPAESSWWYDTVGPHFPRDPGDDLDFLGFSPEVMDWDVGRLSSGERQRLALLRLLVQRPQVLLLDEPTANLDARSAGKVEELLGRIRSENGTALIWAGHDTTQLTRVSHSIYTLSDGKLIRDGA